MSQIVVKRSKEDEYETPNSLFDWLCAKYRFYPEVDVCAKGNNKKCKYYISKERNFDDRYQFGVDGVSDGTNWGKKNWCNPPHSETEKWVKKACERFVVAGEETMMILPANSMCTSYSEACIKPHAEWDMIFERPKFKKDGEHKDSPINSYFVVIWRNKEKTK